MPVSEALQRKREARAALRARRTVRAASKVSHLPPSAESDFFRELQQSFPVQPSIAKPVSQMCTTSQFGEPDYKRLGKMLLMPPRLHRKQWEFM